MFGMLLFVIELVLRVRRKAASDDCELFDSFHDRRLTISQPFLNHITLYKDINFLLIEHHIIHAL
jgi:hypothetical protein